MSASTFVHRDRELDVLNALTRRGSSSFILVYGRRRVGKTTLLRRWAESTGLPTFYWESPRSTADFVRGNLVEQFWRWSQPEQPATSPRFEWWNDVFRVIRREIGDKACNVILDEFPWAVESDPALPSYLKQAWDQLFADSRVRLFISGSHISALEKLLEADAPLFGRFTAKLPVRPLPFPHIAPFVSRYSLDKRLAVFAMLGGVPDYLRQYDDRADLITNIRQIFLSDSSPYRSENDVLISDVLRRDSPDYEAVLATVGRGRHLADEISLETGLPSSRVANVLSTLVDVRLVERRIRASVPVAQHEKARHGRYRLADPFLQFYYRFVAPNRSQIAQGLYEPVERQITEQLRAFVGGAFEDLCRTWTLAQAQQDRLPFAPDYVDSDWSPGYQADVVAVNWRERQVLVGEAKWADDDLHRRVFTELQDRAARVVARLVAAEPASRRGSAADWTAHLILFGRKGATAATRKAAAEVGAQVIGLPQMANDLEDWAARPLR